MSTLIFMFTIMLGYTILHATLCWSITLNSDKIQSTVKSKK